MNNGVMGTPHPDREAIERAIFDEQESNERATAGEGPRDEEQADTFAEEAERAEEDEA